jgi:hypothetical protein
MTLLPRLCLMLALVGLISGCQPGGTSPGATDVTPNAVTGDAIEVTALDAPPSAAPLVVAEASGAAPAEVAAAAIPATATPEGTQVSATDSTEVDAAATGEAEAAALATEVVPPQPPKSERQIACERKRGSWADTGGGFMICITPTRDSGKRCTRESQCENVCLARSQTCAPVTPLMGCHEILQDDGSRATQCID